jgi:hypothetical protein
VIVHAHGQAMAAAEAPRLEHGPPAAACHPGTESVNAGAVSDLGLVGSLRHQAIPLRLLSNEAGLYPTGGALSIAGLRLPGGSRGPPRRGQHPSGGRPRARQRPQGRLYLSSLARWWIAGCAAAASVARSWPRRELVLGVLFVDSFVLVMPMEPRPGRETLASYSAGVVVPER